MRGLSKAVATMFFLGAVINGAAQVQLKNNLLYDASLTPNVNLEVGLSRHWTFDVGYGLNPWNFSDNKKIRHWLLQPEMRRWFCQRWDGSFLAFHLMGGEFNAGGVKLPLGIAPCLHHNRYEGWYVGGGVGYGYQWPISRHFSMEAEVAVGYDYLKYRKYPCKNCGTKTGDGHYHYVGPTKIALNLVYNINRGAKGVAEPPVLRSVAPYARPADAALAAAGEAVAPVKVLGGQATISNATVAPAGSQMVLTMAVDLDSLRLRHAQTVVLRPVLRSADGGNSVRFRPLLINSRDMHVLYLRGEQDSAYPDAYEVRRQNGRRQTVNYLAQLPYEPWMDYYTLEIEEDLCGCGDLIADNVVPVLETTPPVVVPKPEPLNPLELIALADVEPSPYKPPRNLHGTAFINFVVDRWEMKPDYMDNRRELRKITDTLNIMVADHNISVDRIKIHGWASPESPYDHNRMLAQNRAQSLTDYLKTFYRLPDAVFAPAEATPENWIGLLEALDTVPSSLLPNKAAFQQTAREVLDGLSPSATDKAELALKSRYRQDYDYVHKNIYPHLRRSDYEISFRVREFTLDEAKEIYLTHPDQLSLYEFWQVARTFGPGSDGYNRCMERAYTYYPDSTVAAVNVANMALRRGDTQRAEAVLAAADRAASKSKSRLTAAERASLLNARAVLAILQQRYDEADRLLTQAEALGLDVAKNRDALRRLRAQAESEE